MPTLIPTLTLLSILILLNPTNPHCTSKMMKHLFDQQAHKTFPTTPYLRTHCIMDYYWLSACTRPNWLPDSVFCLDVGFPTCSDWNYMSGSRCVDITNILLIISMYLAHTCTDTYTQLDRQKRTGSLESTDNCLLTNTVNQHFLTARG